MNSLIETESGFWLSRETDDLFTLGLTQRAQEDLGELTFVELPSVGALVKKGQSLGIVESVKSVQELIGPLDGEVVEVNARVLETPDIVNESPLGEGWLLKIRSPQPPIS